MTGCCEFVLVSLVIWAMWCLFVMQHPVILCNSGASLITMYSCLYNQCIVTLKGVEPCVKSLYSIDKGYCHCEYGVVMSNDNSL